MNYKILYVAGAINTSNGAYHSLLGSLLALKNKGVNPTVLLRSHGEIEDSFKENGISCKVIPYVSCTIPANDPNRLKGIVKTVINALYETRLLQFLKKEKFDAVHINVGSVSFGAKSANKLGIHLIWHLREFLEDDVNMTYINCDKTTSLLQSSDCIVAISEAVADHFSKNYHLNNIEIIYNGIDLKNVVRFAKKEKSKPVVFALIGRIISEKGQMDALKAFEMVLKKYEFIELLFVGNIGDQNYYNSLCDYIRFMSLQDHVRIMNHQKDLTAVWNICDFGLVCSSREAFGRVTAEFMLNYIPVIGSDTGGTVELLKNSRGILYQCGNVADLASKMIYALEHNEEVETMVDKAALFAENELTSKKNADKLLDVYKNVITD